MNDLQKLFSARQLLLEYLESHAQTCKEKNCEEDSNVIAFLAHAFGMDCHDLRGRTCERLTWYDHNCNQNACTHLTDTPEEKARRKANPFDVRKIDPAGGQRQQ